MRGSSSNSNGKRNEPQGLALPGITSAMMLRSKLKNREVGIRKQVGDVEGMGLSERGALGSEEGV